MDLLSHAWPIHFEADSIHEFSKLDCYRFLLLVLYMVHDDARAHPWLIRHPNSIEQLKNFKLFYLGKKINEICSRSNPVGVNRRHSIQLK